MKALYRQPTMSVLQLLIAVLGFSVLSYALMSVAVGPWRIPASLVLAFFLPVVVSSVVQVYRQFDFSHWHHTGKAS